MPEPRVFTVYGMLPEPLGYSLAKFSRSNRAYKDWARDLTSEQSTKFYEDTAFKYGHNSIKDLAHFAIILEGISQVAVYEMWDSLTDGQESSTRYQDWSTRNFFVPKELAGQKIGDDLVQNSNALVDAYNSFVPSIVDYFRQNKHPPADMDKDSVERTYKARSFDVARYLLAMNSYTGLALFANGRTFEKKIKKLASSPRSEDRDLAASMKMAIMTNPPFNPVEEKLRESFKDRPDILKEVLGICGFGKSLSPTLVKYTDSNPFITNTRDDFYEIAKSLLTDNPSNYGERSVELFEDVPSEVDSVTSLLYKNSLLPYGHIKSKVEKLNDGELKDFLDIANKYRSKHDGLSEETESQRLIFDLCIDVGASRDLNRHRNLVNVSQKVSPLLGYDIPCPPNDPEIVNSFKQEYVNKMEQSKKLALEIGNINPHLSVYALPMAFRRRMLLKMDHVELEYIYNDRTSVQGHFSYRNIVYKAYLLFKEKHPLLTEKFRVTDPKIEDFFKR